MSQMSGSKNREISELSGLDFSFVISCIQGVGLLGSCQLPCQTPVDHGNQLVFQKRNIPLITPIEETQLLRHRVGKKSEGGHQFVVEAAMVDSYLGLTPACRFRIRRWTRNISRCREMHN